MKCPDFSLPVLHPKNDMTDAPNTDATLAIKFFSSSGAYHTIHFYKLLLKLVKKL